MMFVRTSVAVLLQRSFIFTRAFRCRAAVLQKNWHIKQKFNVNETRIAEKTLSNRDTQIDEQETNVGSPINEHATVKDTSFKRTNVLSDVLEDISKQLKFDHQFWENIKEYLGRTRLHNWPMLILSLLANNNTLPAEQTIAAGLSLLSFIADNRGYQKFLKNRGVILCKLLLLSKDPKKELEVFELYESNFKDLYMLDSVTCEMLINGFCNTSRWKESLGFLTQLERFGASYKSSHLHPIASAAIKNQDMKVLFDMLELSAREEIQPSVTLLHYFLHEFSGNHDYVKRLLDYIQAHSLVVSTEGCKVIKDWFERESFQGGSWHSMYGHVTKKGMCSICDQQLPKLRDLSDARFAELRDATFGQSLIKDDLFQNTTPAELERFQKFLDTKGPFDAVVDGLNTGYVKNHRMDDLQAAVVLSLVVQQLTYRQGLKVMVLGREHMKRWPQQYMEQCRKMAELFLIKNESKDDPFMLYSAMSSGPRTYIVTSDYLNDHAARLGDRRPFFRQWQRSHQIVPDLVFFKRTKHKQWEGRVKLTFPATYDCRLTLTDSSCHIPYEEGEERASYILTSSILCLKKSRAKTNSSAIAELITNVCK